MTSTTEHVAETFDFGWGVVPAHRHVNPDGSLGGWVANTAKVDASAQVSDTAQVSGSAQVFGEAWVSGKARVFGKAWVFGEAQVSGKAWVSGEAQVLQVGPVGSRNAMLTIYPEKDGRLACTTGCFENHTLAELLAACAETHGADSPHTRDYKMLATAAFAVLDARLKETPR